MKRDSLSLVRCSIKYLLWLLLLQRWTVLYIFWKEDDGDELNGGHCGAGPEFKELGVTRAACRPRHTRALPRYNFMSDSQ